MDFSEKLARLACDADSPFPNIPLDLINSLPIETDPEWWELRAYLISNDLDNAGTQLTVMQRLNYRIN